MENEGGELARNSGLFNFYLQTHIHGFLRVIDLLKHLPGLFVAGDLYNCIGNELVDIRSVIGRTFSQLPYLL